MPLLRKKEFQRTTIPELLRDDEEVFHCVVTNEVFRDYDEFCQRIILVNSMVWSCAMTGKSNLTYAEALQSEQAAKKSLKDFPMELRIPVLFLASKTKRSAFGEMAEDVFAFMKDRYFVGEIVDSSFTENNWQESYVLQVIAPTNEQIETYNKTNIINKSSERNFSPPATLFRYEVEQLDANDQDSSQVMIVEANHVRRKKGPFSKEKLRLFLKQFVELKDNGIYIKESVKRKYKFDKVRFDQLFDGPVPEFEQTKKVVKSAVNGKAKKIRQESISNFLTKGNTLNGNGNGKFILDEMKRKETEYRIKLEEMKQKRVEEKQKRKEESVKIATFVKDWNKPRDDLYLEDQKPIPTPTQVQMKIPATYFGDALAILEFVNSFSTVLSLKDVFPGGLTLEFLERALIEKEVAGPLTDIVQMLLTAIFKIQDVEATESKNKQMDLNADDAALPEGVRLATLASNWSIVYQGLPLNRLPLYPVTISEILRLHLLSSGARINEAATRWRYQQRGGYTNEDDPGLQFRLQHPHILKALTVHNFNQLSIGDKLKIILCLIDQLLTYADVRDTIEERSEKSKNLKAELRSLQTLEKKNETDFVSAKFKLKREHKGDDKEVMTKELNKIENEAEEKRADLEYKINKILKSLSNYQSPNLGMDRSYQKYIKIESVPGFFVENAEQFPGCCLDKIVTQNPELIDAGQEETMNYVKKLYEENPSSSSSDKENDNGLKKNPKKINGARYSVKTETEITNTRNLLMCTANNQPCPVHSNHNKPSWGFYHQEDDIQTLISSLNKRGVRESELRQTLEMEKEHLVKMVTKTYVTKLNPSIEATEDMREKYSTRKIPKALRYTDSHLGFPVETDVAEILSLSLVDNILEMEDKIHSGNLGQLKVNDRDAWRTNLNNRNFIDLDKTLIKKDENNLQVEKIKVEGKNNNSRPNTPDKDECKNTVKYLNAVFEMNGLDMNEHSDEEEIKPIIDQENAIKTLAIALLQVAQAVENKFLLPPLGQANEAAPKKDSSSKKKDLKNIIGKWEQSLMSSTSYSQIFLHYCTLDNCIMWRRSTLLANCQVCRKKGDPENMLLCDNCNKGHHMYCLKPKLTSVPKGDWFCDKCKPEQEVPAPRTARKVRKIFTEEDEDSEEEEEEEEEEEDIIEEEEEVEKEKEVILLEVCEECGSGGHVICCDSCPKVYHLECTQPVLRRVPRGEWKCHKCRRKSNKSREKLDTTYDKSESDSGSVEEYTQQRRSTRRAHDSKGGDVDLPLNNASLQELLADVMKHKDAWPFTRPVTKQEVPDYFDVIKNPMDFGTIKYKLNMGEYHHDAQVMMDSALVFENCDTYNNSEADVYKCGIRLLKYFEKRARDYGFNFPKNVMGNLDSDEDDNGPPPPKKSRYQ